MSIIKRSITAVALSFVVIFSMSACSSEINVSDDTKAEASRAICGLGGVLVSQLSAGGAITKTAAGLIADNATDENIKSIATKVKNGNMDKELIKELSNYVKELCK